MNRGSCLWGAFPGDDGRENGSSKLRSVSSAAPLYLHSVCLRFSETATKGLWPPPKLFILEGVSFTLALNVVLQMTPAFPALIPASVLSSHRRPSCPLLTSALMFQRQRCVRLH